MQKIIENFTTQGGKHCITNSLKQIFSYYGYSLSEEMMFGLASGLSFIYINQSNYPMINGRIKVFEFEKKLAERLNIKIRCRAGKVYSRIFDITKNMIDNNNPVLIYVDMPYLNYLHLNKNSHFGGHAVVLFGYDDSSKKFWVSDRDNSDYQIKVPTGLLAQDYHLVDYDEIQKARSSTYPPFPANNKYLVFDFQGYTPVSKKILFEAISETCKSMLNPPAQLLGVNGILKFSKEIVKWKQFNPQKLRSVCATNYFQISRDGGTGGGIFRNMYGEFLIEVSSILDDMRFYELGKEFINASKLWDNIADTLWQLSLNGNLELLSQMSTSIFQIYEIEKALFHSLSDIASETAVCNYDE
ncbi:BtrH N-terminal domain-containing protein [Thomasclavelia ramosa]|uniref:BtrH N-terminal domain-containing protein n=1 Tax=Thomasclavelia ramosa TaxID=1547 RepID=UPI003DA4F79A